MSKSKQKSEIETLEPHTIYKRGRNQFWVEEETEEKGVYKVRSYPYTETETHRFAPEVPNMSVLGPSVLHKVEEDVDLSELMRYDITFAYTGDEFEITGDGRDDRLEVEREFRGEYGLETNVGVEVDGQFAFETSVSKKQLVEILQLDDIEVLECELKK
jgi:hypothetical protein